MAKKKTKRRKSKGKRRMSPAQRAALKKMQAALKASRQGGKKRRKTKAKRRKGKRRSKRRMGLGESFGRAHASRSNVGSHYHSGARGYSAGIAAHRPKKRRVKRHKAGCAPKARKGHAGKRKHTGVVSAATILKNAKSKGMKVWSCAGVRRTGCGGGRKGGHVVGHLR